MSDFHFSRERSSSKNERFFRITSANFPVMKGMAVQDLDMAPGDSRAPHYHPNATQLDYCIAGKGQVGIVGSDGEHHLIDLAPGDAAFVPQGYVHWITNTSDTASRFILIASHERPETIEVEQLFDAVLRNTKRS